MSVAKKILIVDDDLNVLEVLGARLSSAGYGVTKATSGKDALDTLRGMPVDLLISDIKMPHMGGMELLAEAKTLFPEMPVLFLTAYGTVPDAVAAVKSGALDYLEKPFDGRKLISKLNRIFKDEFKLQAGRDDQVKLPSSFSTKSPVMKTLYGHIEKVAASDVNVLILGESGVGKERVARFIHEQGPRRDKPLVAVDCGATPPGLLESELFGHVKGAFTHAIRDRKGLIEAADGGTLFLDEIGNISPEMQIRLLRFLEDRKIRKVGDIKEMSIDCRVVAATNSDLQGDIAAGRFREDLYFRLRVVALNVPPLRDRKEDIPQLARHFVEIFCTRQDIPSIEIPPETLEWLQEYPWPGNVRELKNALEGAVVFNSDGKLRISDLHLSGLPETARTFPGREDTNQSFSLEESERSTIVRALKQAGGVQKAAAELLGISRRAVHYKINKYDISSSETQAGQP